ncbi:MAG: hypothetical protein ABL859_04580 [Methylotenera sp.]|nr:hypothetical protein [Methyloglobulus sp.]
MLVNEDFLKVRFPTKSNKMLYLVLVILVTLLFFGDSVLLFTGHCLYLVFEFVASLTEHWLQAIFNLTKQQAQIVFFYLFAAIVGYITWTLSKKIYKKTQQVCISVHCRTKQRMERVNWSQLIFLFTIFGTFILTLT